MSYRSLLLFKNGERGFFVLWPAVLLLAVFGAAAGFYMTKTSGGDASPIAEVRVRESVAVDGLFGRESESVLTEESVPPDLPGAAPASTLVGKLAESENISTNDDSWSGAFDRALTLESRGADVAALQKILIARGFLNKSEGSLGTFDQDTVDALKKYQESVGIAPANGSLGPLTAATLLRSVEAEEVARPPKNTSPADHEQESNGEVLDISPKPDLILSDVSCTPTVPRVRWPIDCSLTAYNQSSVDITEPFDVGVQGTTLRVEAPLLAGEKRTVTEQNAFSLYGPGDSVLNFSVDARNVIDEADEGNNVFTKTITTQLPSISLSNSSGDNSVVAGETYPIRWTSTGNLAGEFRLDYIREEYYQAKSGGSVFIANVSGPADSYDWQVPGNLSGQFRIILGYRDYPVGGESFVDYSDAYLTVVPVQ